MNTKTATGRTNRSPWHLELDLAEAGAVTTLTFAESVPDPAMERRRTRVGPLRAHRDYYPELAEHYKAEFGS